MSLNVVNLLFLKIIFANSNPIKSHSTSTAEILSSMEDQLAMIEKQVKTIRQLNLSNRILEESKLIKAY